MPRLQRLQTLLVVLTVVAVAAVEMVDFLPKTISFATYAVFPQNFLFGFLFTRWHDFLAAAVLVCDSPLLPFTFSGCVVGLRVAKCNIPRDYGAYHSVSRPNLSWHFAVL